MKFLAYNGKISVICAETTQLVEEASASKAPIAKLADKVSGVFVPCVITIAALATIFWILQGQSFEFYFLLLY